MITWDVYNVMRGTSISNWFNFFIQWHINLCGLFNAKNVLVEEQEWYYLTNSLGDKDVHTFPKDSGPNVYIIVRLEFKLTNVVPSISFQTFLGQAFKIIIDS